MQSFWRGRSFVQQSSSMAFRDMCCDLRARAARWNVQVIFAPAPLAAVSE